MLKKVEPAAEFLFFSDGLNTYGNLDYSVLPANPVYAINASPNANYAVLKYMAAKTGGAFINLNEQPLENAIKQLTDQSLQFLGIKENRSISGLYPDVATPVAGNISIAGISNQPNTSITLLFGYGSKIVLEKRVELDFEKQQSALIDIERIWASKKIASLEILAEDNKSTISSLGKKYGLVTANTSLIVLDAVEDYAKYEIEPPAELKPAYFKLIREKKTELSVIKNKSIDEATRYYDELRRWWSRDYKQISRRPVKPLDESLINTERITAGYVTPEAVHMILDKTVDSVAFNFNSNLTVPLSGIALNASTNMAFTTRTAPLMQVTAGAGSYSQSETQRIDYLSGFSNETVKIEDRKQKVGDTFLSSYEWKSSGRFDSAHSVIAYYDSLGNSINTPGELDTVLTDVTLHETIPERPYQRTLDSATKEDLYSKYLALRKDYLMDPVYYFDAAKRFFRNGDTATGLRVLSNIADLNFDDHELYKLLGYQLKALKQYKEAVNVFKKVLTWRPQDPQSYRDYGLALSDAGRFQEALDTLYFSLTKNFDEEISSLYPGIEEIIVTDINNIIALHGNKINISRIDKRIIRNLPVDIRVVLNWNMNDTDIDLWVTDPNDEKCYFNNKLTQIGGRISNDFVNGYGPEQFMLKKAVKGKYKVETNYFNDSQQKLAGPTTIMAEIFTHYGKPDQTSKTIAIQMEKTENDHIFIGEFEF
jgi:hypothetical protein